MVSDTRALLNQRAWRFLGAAPGTPGHWIALFGAEVLAVAPTLREVLVVLALTPLPGRPLVHQFTGLPGTAEMPTMRWGQEGGAGA